jgi:N6-adenosine-specific RNA methylase IME4
MKYRTIVADPPWEYDSWPVSSSPTARNADYARRHGLRFEPNRRTPIKYPTMTVEEIAKLPVGDFAESSGCHIYLWTTNRYLRQGFRILTAWGVRYSQLLVWAKSPMGLGPGGAFAQNAEYIMFGRIGSLSHLKRQESVWFNWPRTGTHSKKPEAFLDLVEQVSPGPYLELFARRQRLGWDTWGDEALNHVEMSA